MAKQKKPQQFYLHGDLIIFTSEDGDWYCVAVKTNHDHIHLLYEGHDRDLAYESIFEQIGLDLKVVTKDMSAGSFVPTEQDWTDANE